MIELETIPKGWTIAKLEEVCEMYQPHTISTKQLKSDGKYWVYGANGIIGKYDRYNHEHSELLVTCRGASCGSVNISRPYSWINGNAMVVRPIDTNLLLLNFIEMFFRGGFNVKKAISGSAQPQITRTSLNPLEIPIPPLNEQKRILAKLEQLLTDLDKGIEYLETTKQQLKVYRQAVLKWAFEGKLTNKNVKNGELPEGWEWKNSGELFSFVTSGSRGWAKYYSKDGAIFIRITNLDFDTLEIDLTPEKIQYVNPPLTSEGIRTKVQEGDFLFSITGYLGMFAIAPKLGNAFVNQHISLCRPKSGFNKKFIGYWIISKSGGYHHLNKLQKGATKAGLGLDDIKGFPVPIAPKEEQDKIVSEIESRLSVCNKIEETIESSLQQAVALRLSIIKKAFEGKLVPQDPNDEPAERLLERIRAAKGNGKPEKKEKVKVEKKVKTKLIKEKV